MARIMGGWVRSGIAGAALLLAALTPGDGFAQKRPDEAILEALQRFTNTFFLGPLGGSPSPSIPSPGPSPGPGLPPPPGASLLPPGGGVPTPTPAPTLAPPAQLAPAMNAPPATPASQVALALSARYGRDLPQPITGGLVWRIYSVRPDQTGAFRP